MDFRSELRDFILENFLPGEAPDNLKDDANLLAGIIDSLAVVQLVDFVEKKGGVDVPYTEVKQIFRSIDDIVSYVATKRGK